ncbi:MAG: HU family DNA-binding protein [candidate division Zixibacteria bacterium]|nr:HU family DNA-binding protein [Candidatus Tariuqbacter arcticus]
MKNITKNDIIDLLIQRTGEKRDITAKLVNEVFTVLRDLMSSADSGICIKIHDFGVFEVLPVKTRKNSKKPQSAETGPKAARREIYFQPGIYLKKALKKP